MSTTTQQQQQRHRTKALSLSSSSSPYLPSPSSPPLASNNTTVRPRLLSKSSSLADLRSTLTPKRLLKRFQSKDELDVWGCKGELVEQEEQEGQEQGMMSTGRWESHMIPPPSYTTLLPPLPLSTKPAPPRPPPVSLSSSCWSKEALRTIEREKEAQEAESAMLAYMKLNSPSSRRGSLIAPAVGGGGGGGGGVESRRGSLAPLEEEDGSGVVGEVGGAEGRWRSSSTGASSVCSSRPRTGDSLPSYHSGPPGSPALGRRPSLGGSGSSTMMSPSSSMGSIAGKMEGAAPPQGQRAYSFI